jgi:hypothetical protein
MKFISFWSVFLALKERRCWAFCAAMATDEPLPCGPNLRLLRDVARSANGVDGGIERG